MVNREEIRPGDLVMCWVCARRGLLIKRHGTLEQHEPLKGKKTCPASGQRWPEPEADTPAVLEHLQ